MNLPEAGEARPVERPDSPSIGLSLQQQAQSSSPSPDRWEQAYANAQTGAELTAVLLAEVASIQAEYREQLRQNRERVRQWAREMRELERLGGRPRVPIVVRVIQTVLFLAFGVLLGVVIQILF